MHKIHTLQIVEPIYIGNWLKSKEAITLSHKQNLQSSATFYTTKKRSNSADAFESITLMLLAKTKAKFLQISRGAVGIRALSCHRTGWAS